MIYYYITIIIDGIVWIIFGRSHTELISGHMSFATIFLLIKIGDGVCVSLCPS